MFRLLNQSPSSYGPCDDVVAGLVIKHSISPEGHAEETGKRMLTSLLCDGISPEDASVLLSKKE